MSETTSFTDPVFLARFGLFRANAIDYFLHPLNPFRTTANTSNEVLAMQGTTIGLLLQQHALFPHQNAAVVTPQAAEDEYNKALSRLTGEQYELLPPADASGYTQPTALYTIRHVLRTSPTSTKILGLYYIVEGVIYKSPAVRSLFKANVARTTACLHGATVSLSACARYLPSSGYQWVFGQSTKSSSRKRSQNDKETAEEEEDDELSPYELMRLHKQRKRRKPFHRRPGERTAAEEEGIRATEALDQILVRLSKSALVQPPTHGKVPQAAISTLSDIVSS